MNNKSTNMNSLILFGAMIACALAAPTGEQVVSVSHGSLGDYDIKYATDIQSRSEQRNILGEVKGAYSYVDPHGLLRKVAYTADKHGFQAIGSGIPLPVQDTPEVAHAKAEHLLRKAELKHFVPEIVEAPIAQAQLVEISQPLARTYVDKILVQQAPEVAFAKPQHLLRKAEVTRFVEAPIEAQLKLVEISQPLARTYVEKIAVKETPEIAFVKGDHFLRKAEVSRFVPEIVEAPIETQAKLVEISQPLARTYVEKIAVKETPEIAFVKGDHFLRKAEVSRFVPEIVEAPIETQAKLVEISQPLARTYVQKIDVRDNPEIAFVKSDHLLRKADVTRFVPELVETPIAAPAKLVEISQPLARTYVDKYVTEPLVRIAPTSPEVLELEAKQFAAHVARKNHY